MHGEPVGVGEVVEVEDDFGSGDEEAMVEAAEETEKKMMASSQPEVTAAVAGVKVSDDAAAEGVEVLESKDGDAEKEKEEEKEEGKEGKAVEKEGDGKVDVVEEKAE